MNLRKRHMPMLWKKADLHIHRSVIFTFICGTKSKLIHVMAQQFQDFLSGFLFYYFIILYI